MNILFFGTGASSHKEYNKLKETIRETIKCGITHFDTAPSYGTEQVLGRILTELGSEMKVTREQLFIQTKVDAWQMQERNIEKFISSVAEYFGGYIDSLLIHWPVPEYMQDTWNAMCFLREAGVVKQIGMCNLQMRQLSALNELVQMPQNIQLERHPLRNCEREIEFCHRNGIEVQVYSPLCKMHEKILQSQVLNDIAQKYDKNIGQVVLRWHLDTGVVPIFTSTKRTRIQEYTDIFDFTLSMDEVEIINKMNENHKMYLESMACPGF